MRFIGRILNLSHPLLRRLYLLYSSRTHNYRFDDIRIRILPGVFHPGLFHSTKILLEFIAGEDITGKKVLELGAGTGLISIFCRRRGALKATASDISPRAIQNIRQNAELNNTELEIIESDLFDSLRPDDYDYILINPPFYPKSVQNAADYPWFCGRNFEYFKKLFGQLRAASAVPKGIFMVLSETCDVERISELARAEGLRMTAVFQKMKLGENFQVFSLN